MAYDSLHYIRLENRMCLDMDQDISDFDKPDSEDNRNSWYIQDDIAVVNPGNQADRNTLLNHYGVSIDYWDRMVKVNKDLSESELVFIKER